MPCGKHDSGLWEVYLNPTLTSHPTLNRPRKWGLTKGLFQMEKDHMLFSRKNGWVVNINFLGYITMSHTVNVLPTWPAQPATAAFGTRLQGN